MQTASWNIFTYKTLTKPYIHVLFLKNEQKNLKIKHLATHLAEDLARLSNKKQ